MPRILEAYDDMDWADGQRRTLATETLTVGLDGDVAELVLSGPNAEKVRKYMRDLIALGRRVDTSMPRPSGQSRMITGRRSRDPVLSAYRKRLREWCQGYGIMNPKDPTLLAYMSSAGNWNYSKWLTDQFDAYEADQARAAAERNERILNDSR